MTAAARRLRDPFVVLVAAIVVLAIPVCYALSPSDRAPVHRTLKSADQAVLTPKHNELVQLLPAEASDLTDAAFVEITILAIDNPDNASIQFNLSLRIANGEERFLGTFAPFPPNNPGRFVVAAGDQLVPGGALILRMEPIAPILSDAEIAVAIAPLILIRR